MNLDVRCPGCGESERANLAAKREGQILHVKCKSCGEGFDHDTLLCPGCGERELVVDRRPLLMKARGTQQSIIGYRSAYRCPACEWASEGPAETNAAE